jgi:hypothetical protein
VHGGVVTSKAGSRSAIAPIPGVWAGRKEDPKRILRLLDDAGWNVTPTVNGAREIPREIGQCISRLWPGLRGEHRRQVQGQLGSPTLNVLVACRYAAIPKNLWLHYEFVVMNINVHHVQPR